MRWLLIVFALALPGTSKAEGPGELVSTVVSEHILPGFLSFAQASEALKRAALSDCRTMTESFRLAYHDAFDAWLKVSHLRFGPTEIDDRAFAIAFWPDSKGFTPKKLMELIRSEDPSVNSPADFASVSIAARGFFALEFLLYDEALSNAGAPDYRCALIKALATDIHMNADAILTDWQEGYAEVLQNPDPAARYKTEDEAVQELFKALLTGLQFTSDTRLGRPLGTFDRPRPLRAEARRSGRSLHHVQLSLNALEELALLLAEAKPEVAVALSNAFARSQAKIADLDDPVLAGVADSQGRFRVEVLQQNIDRVREIAVAELGPALGVAAGFNALDGD